MDNDILTLIKKVLDSELDKSYKYFLFWSRAKWNYRFRSDYDIWIMWDKKIDYIKKIEIEEKFEKIPALIDLIDFANVTPEFKKIAMKNIIWLN